MPSVPASGRVPGITPAHLALHHTRFANWFPLYRRHTPKATVIDVLQVQPDFVDWLQEDGIVLPQGSDESRDAELSDYSDDSESEAAAEPRNFDALNERIRQVLAGYEGAVFPKLDWSAPLDAAWIVPGASLRCTTPSDVYLLLKSSDFISKDIKQLQELDRMGESSNSHADSNVRPMLVLKKFFSIPTSHEFRCFVRAGRLICISQRDAGTFFEHLQEGSTQLTIRRLLQAFFSTVLRPSTTATTSGLSSGSSYPLDDFVWDAYISRDMSRVFLVDINPYLERTDALLWTWEELEELAEEYIRTEELAEDNDENGSEEETVMRIYTDGRPPVLLRNDEGTSSLASVAHSSQLSLPQLRTVASRAQTTQSFPTYARNMVPSDVVGAAEGNSIAEFARDWNDKIAKAARGEADVDDDSDEEIGVIPGR